METEEAIEKIAKLKQSEVGPTEENVKQKIVVPLLEFLGHKREDLEFEYRTRRAGKIDIFIKNVPADCKVVIDTKNYSENLAEHIDQIKEYTFDEGALLAVIANGTEIRIYSPLRGVAFERSLLYSFDRHKLSEHSVWRILSDLLHNDNLRNRNVLKKIDEREREIKNAMADEDRLRDEYSGKVEGVDSEIEAREKEIEQLKSEREHLTKEATTRVSDIWSRLGLPVELRTSAIPPLVELPGSISPTPKAGKVTLEELVNARLIRNGQILYFYHTRLFEDEQGEVVASLNKLRYKKNGKIYSVSKLAEVLLRERGLKGGEHGVAGPRFWMTEQGELLNDLNEKVREKRGDRG